jgi:hypothetical protein
VSVKPPLYWHRDFHWALKEARLPLPALQAQQHTTKAVEAIERLLELEEQKMKTLRELRASLLYNWKGRDTETGKQRTETP